MLRSGDVPSRGGDFMRGIGVILCSSVMFGAMAVCVRLAARDMAADQIAFVRFAGSLGVLLALRGGRGLRPAGRLPPVLLRGVLGGSAIILYYRGIAGAGAGLATLLHCTYPIWTALISTTLLRERFDARLAGALALFAVGIGIIVGPGADLSRAASTGTLFALAASVLAGAAVATARQLRQTETAYLVTTWFMAVGAAMTAPAVMGGLPPLDAGMMLALLGVVLTSVAGQVLLHQGLGFAPATQASLAAATSVISAAGLEAAALGAHLSAHTLIGTAVLVAAIALAVSRR